MKGRFGIVMMILLVGDRRRSIDSHCRWPQGLHGLGDFVQHGGEVNGETSFGDVVAQSWLALWSRHRGKREQTAYERVRSADEHLSPLRFQNNRLGIMTPSSPLGHLATSLDSCSMGAGCHAPDLLLLEACQVNVEVVAKVGPNGLMLSSTGLRELIGLQEMRHTTLTFCY